jgi:hypothetical protein
MRTWNLSLLNQLFRLALSALHVLATAASPAFKSRATLHLENLALGHQLGVLRRSVKRPKLTSADRLLWAWLCEVWIDWRSSLVIVKPKPSLAGTARASGCSGLGTFVRANPAPTGVERDSPTDSEDEPRESALGRAPHPRRIAENRHRYRRDQRGQVHCAQPECATPTVTAVPARVARWHR